MLTVRKNEKEKPASIPQIIFEDSSIFIINKPAGWVVNEANTTRHLTVLQTWIRNNFDFETAKSKEFRSGIVHRLDKETSGILIIAKTTQAFEALQREFKERRVKKIYTALVHGNTPEKGHIDAPVGRLPWRRDRFGVLPGGRDAETDYQTVRHYLSSDKSEYSLVELMPKTGRTHQIRIHMKHIGHPLVSDEFYAGRKTARNDRKWCERLFLHASKITFIHPTSGEEVSFKAPFPPDLEFSLSCLQGN